MKIKMFVLVLILAASCFAQSPSTNVPSGSLSFSAVGGPFGSAGVDIFGTYGVTTYGELREDNYLFPAVNGSAFFGSYQYALDRFTCPMLINTNISCAKFSSYVNAGAGVGRTTIGPDSTNHVGGGFGAGINFDPTGHSQYTINLLDFHYNHFTFDTIKGWTPVVSSGITLNFGSNKLGTEAKMRMVRRQEAKKLKRMQARAAKLDKD